jgi:hypothetical protein
MESEVETIQAPKKPKTEKALAGLAAGRAKLAEINKAKAEARTQMLKEALEKKNQRKQDRDAKLLKEIDLAIGSLDENVEETKPQSSPVSISTQAREILTKGNATVSRKTKTQQPAQIKGHVSTVHESKPEIEEQIIKKPKRKVIRYVEESSSEEEEIVYVKREKKVPKQIHSKVPQQQYHQQILFY